MAERQVLVKVTGDAKSVAKAFRETSDAADAASDDLEKFAKSAERSFDKTTEAADDTKSKLAKFGASLKSAFAFTPTDIANVAQGLSRVVGSFTNAARESERVSKITEQVIKQTGSAANLTADQIGKMATALSNKTAIDDEAIQTGQNLLLTFKGIKEQAGEGNDIFTRASTAMLDLSTVFGSVDGAAMQLGKALNDPIAGMGALSRAGVTFSDDQKKAIKAFVESNDLLSAQKIILREVESQVGGTAAATATNSDRMRVAFGNVQEAIGAKLLPVMERLSGWIVDRLIPAGERAAEWFGNKVTPKLRELAYWVHVDLVPALKDMWSWFHDDILPILGDVVDALRPLITDVGRLTEKLTGFNGEADETGRRLNNLSWVGKVLEGALRGAAFAAEVFIGQVRGVVGLLSGFVDQVNRLGGVLQDWARIVVNWAAPAAARVAAALEGLGSNMGDAIANGLKRAMSAALNWAIDQANKVLGKLDFLPGADRRIPSITLGVRPPAPARETNQAGGVGSTPYGPTPTSAVLATIRRRESGNNYGADTAKGSASGAYQFVDGTWQSLTKKFGIGTQYRRAVDAPPEVQDAVAQRYVAEIVKSAGGSIAAVPRVWYTGANTQGKAADHVVPRPDFGNKLTPAQYSDAWMRDLAKSTGSRSAVSNAIRTEQQVRDANPTKAETATTRSADKLSDVDRGIALLRQQGQTAMEASRSWERAMLDNGNQASRAYDALAKQFGAGIDELQSSVESTFSDGSFAGAVAQFAAAVATFAGAVGSGGGGGGGGYGGGGAVVPGIVGGDLLPQPPELGSGTFDGETRQDNAGNWWMWSGSRWFGLTSGSYGGGGGSTPGPITIPGQDISPVTPTVGPVQPLAASIVVNVEGSVLSERDLTAAVVDGLRRAGAVTPSGAVVVGR